MSRVLARLLIGTFVVASYSASRLSSGLQLQAAYQCDVEECESLLVKCQYTERCFSTTFDTDASQAKECLDCLEEKAHLCCGCIGLCPASNSKLHPAHVGIMINENEDFFQNFSKTSLMKRDWDVTRLEIEATALLSPEINTNKLYSSLNLVEDRNNCLVAFMKTKVSLTTCRRSCYSMGAASYRWFRMGCCECIGKHCHNYGIHNPLCKMLQ